MSRTSSEKHIQRQGAGERGLVLFQALPGTWPMVNSYTAANNCCKMQQVYAGVTPYTRGSFSETNFVLVFKEFVQQKADKAKRSSV